MSQEGERLNTGSAAWNREPSFPISIAEPLNSSWQEADMTVNKCPMIHLITAGRKMNQSSQERKVKLQSSWIHSWISLFWAGPARGAVHAGPSQTPNQCLYMHRMHLHPPPSGNCITLESVRCWFFIYIYRRHHGEKSLLSPVFSHTSASLSRNGGEPAVLFCSTESWGWKRRRDDVGPRRVNVCAALVGIIHHLNERTWRNAACQQSNAGSNELRGRRFARPHVKIK